jgi:ATP-dependent DNA helicase RecQ
MVADCGLTLNGLAMRYYTNPAFKRGAFTNPDPAVRREASDLERLRDVVELAEQKRCLTRFVTAHFGEKLGAPCGHCDRCRGVPPAPLPRTRQPEPAEDELRAIQALRGEGHAALKSPRQLARFLCGIGSPAVTRARLTRDDRFGLLERLPFAEVLALAETL